MDHEKAVMKQMTVRDIARKAGVSVATVSRVLNSKCVVREETRARVMNILSKEDYSINSNAAALARLPRSTLRKQDRQNVAPKKAQRKTAVVDVLDWIESETAAVGLLIEELSRIRESLKALARLLLSDERLSS